MTANDQSAGATPAAGGATPSQTPPANAAQPQQPTNPAQPAPGTSTAASGQPATGSDDALGEGGRRALEAERLARRAADDRSKALEEELNKLRTDQLSDSEKAIRKAKDEGATEERAKLAGQVRRSEVRAALTAAGITTSVLDLAVNASEFAALKVNDEGVVEGLEAAVGSFKTARKDLFGTPGQQGGSSDGGTRGSGSRLTRDQIRAWSKDPIEYERHREEIFAWMQQGGTV